MNRRFRGLWIIPAILLASIPILLMMSAAPAAASRATLHPHIKVVEQIPGNHAEAFVTGKHFASNSSISITVRVPARNIEFTYTDVATTDDKGSFSYDFAIYMFAGQQVYVTATDGDGNSATGAIVVA